MTDNKTPEQARASPKQSPRPLRLNGRFIKGGEVFEWTKKIEIVTETKLSQEGESDDLDEHKELDQEIEGSSQVSVMLILQILTLFVAVAALIAAA